MRKSGQPSKFLPGLLQSKAAGEQSRVFLCSIQNCPTLGECAHNAIGIWPTVSSRHAGAGVSLRVSHFGNAETMWHLVCSLLALSGTLLTVSNGYRIEDPLVANDTTDPPHFEPFARGAVGVRSLPSNPRRTATNPGNQFHMSHPNIFDPVPSMRASKVLLSAVPCGHASSFCRALPGNGGWGGWAFLLYSRHCRIL